LNNRSQPSATFFERVSKQYSLLLVKSKLQGYRKMQGLLVDSFADSGGASAWSIIGLQFSPEGVT
jgi:hypothetical protein